MTVQTRQTVSLLDLAKGAARMAPDLPLLLKGAPGLLLRKPKDKKSVGLLLQELAAKQPDRPFLKFEGRTETYGEANRIVNRYTAVLAERGRAAGRRRGPAGPQRARDGAGVARHRQDRCGRRSAQLQPAR